MYTAKIAAAKTNRKVAMYVSCLLSDACLIQKGTMSRRVDPSGYAASGIRGLDRKSVV